MKNKLIIILLALYGNFCFSNNINELFEKLKKSESTVENNKLIKEIEQLKLSDSLKAELSFYKAKTLYMESKYNDALISFNKSSDAFKKLNYKNRVLENKIFISQIYRRNEKYDESLKLLVEIEKEKEFFNDKSELYFYLSVIYFDFIEIKKSLEFANLAQEEALKNNNKTSLAKVYNMFSVVYHFNKDIPKALEYSQKSLKLAVEQKNYLQTILMFNNIGYLYTEQGKYSESLKTLSKAQDYFKYTKNDYLFYFNAVLTAKNKYKLGDYDEALKLTNDVIIQTQELKLHEVLAIAYINKADIFNSKKQYADAEKFYKDAYELGKSNNKTDIVVEALDKLIALSKKTNQLAKNITFLNLKIELNEKIYKSEKEKELKIIDVKNNIAKYELELQNKNKQIELLNLKSTQQNYQFIMLLLVVFGLSLFIYRQKKINRITKSNAEYLEEINNLKEIALTKKINFSSNQITEFAIQIQDQNKHFQNFKDRLGKVIKSIENQENVNEVKKIIYDINNVIELNNDKIKLNTEISNVTDDFLFKLKEQFPDLNEKEIQILTYLRMNYETKQIASILSITNQSVNNYRASIRKKLNLSKTDNLIQFLKDL
ncbi:tetratricopeptide repeat protein [Flavobacterium sp. LMO8]|uniref:tetratricopeptide repeat protein n=1 Tax=Flavobacterium sp. LMO8 TaxID=2654244 RepID=UPI00129249C5|nr:tetratricopeptide repeat protein [Flavobacterium sp. LMO8]MQP25650.1 tetratricopeptide repeat protein [Flavobacterium sp. LMO8]